jgi:hypothetical protein
MKFSGGKFGMVELIQYQIAFTMIPTFGKNSIYKRKLLLNSALVLYMKNSLFEQFFHLPQVSLTPVAHLLKL